MALFHQPPKMLFQRISADTSGTDHIANCHAAMIADLVDNLRGAFGKGRDDQLFTLHLFGEAPLLLLQGAKKIREPRLPVRRVGPDGALGLAQTEVITFLAVFYDALKRAVGDIRAPSQSRNSAVIARGIPSTRWGHVSRERGPLWFRRVPNEINGLQDFMGGVVVARGYTVGSRPSAGRSRSAGSHKNKAILDMRYDLSLYSTFMNDFRPVIM